MENIRNNWKPKRWLATLLSLLLYASGLLYLGRFKLTLIYWLAEIFLGILLFFTLGMKFAAVSTALVRVVSALQSYKTASNYKTTSTRPWYSFWWGIPIFIIGFLVFPIVILRAFLFEPFHIPSASMAPSYEPGNYILVSKQGYGNYGAYGFNLMRRNPTKTIHRGEPFVFSYPSNPKIDFIQRAIGLPNDKISYKNKQLFVNNKLIEVNNTEQKSSITTKDGLIIKGTIVKEQIDGSSWYVFKTNDIPTKDYEMAIPENHYFMMGDNRDNSNDSRIWGSLPTENLKGKVIYSTGEKK